MNSFFKLSILFVLSFSLISCGGGDGGSSSAAKQPISYSIPDAQKIYNPTELVSIDVAGDAIFPESSTALIHDTSVELIKIEGTKYGFLLPVLPNGVYDLVITAPDGNVHTISLNVELLAIGVTPQESVTSSVAQLMSDLSLLSTANQTELQPLVDELNVQLANMQNLSPAEQEWLAMFLLSNISQPAVAPKTVAKSSAYNNDSPILANYIATTCSSAKAEFVAHVISSAYLSGVFATSIPLAATGVGGIATAAAALAFGISVHQTLDTMDGLFALCQVKTNSYLNELSALPKSVAGITLAAYTAPGTLSFVPAVSRNFYIDSSYDIADQEALTNFDRFKAMITRVFSILPTSLQTTFQPSLSVKTNMSVKDSPTNFSITNISNNNIQAIVSSTTNQLVVEFDFINPPTANANFTFNLVDNRTGIHASSTQHSASLNMMCNDYSGSYSIKGTVVTDTCIPTSVGTTSNETVTIVQQGCTITKINGTSVSKQIPADGTAFTVPAPTFSYSFNSGFGDFAGTTTGTTALALSYDGVSKFNVSGNGSFTWVNTGPTYNGYTCTGTTTTNQNFSF